MKSRWVLIKLREEIPIWVSSLLSRCITHSSGDSSGTRYLLDHVNISLLLSSSGREKHLRLGSSIHASIIKIPEFFNPFINQRNLLVVWNSLLAMYAKCGEFTNAANLFDEMPVRDTVSCNTMLSMLLRNGEMEKGFVYVRKMQELGIYRFDQATLTTILSACDDEPCLAYFNEIIHAFAFSNGFENEVSVGNALITSYFKYGKFSSGRKVFDEMVMNRNVVTWTAMMSGLLHNNCFEESLSLFVEMHKGSVEANSLTYLSSLTACSGLQALEQGEQIHALVWKLGYRFDLYIESALMDMYSKCGTMGNVLRIFDSAKMVDDISMTVVLVGFAQNGFEQEAVEVFRMMVNSGIEIDPNMVSAVLGVFGLDTSLFFGKQIHSLAIKKQFCSNTFVSNGLINMYSKCGDLEDAKKVFNWMSCKNSITWNTMISAFARHGRGLESLELYSKMTKEIEPTDVTFLSLLHACSHVGLVKKGVEFLNSMIGVYKIAPRMEHYACIVDMLGRAGLLYEAKAFIEELPLNPGVLVWESLLGACSIHGDPEMGKYAANKLSSIAHNSASPYVSMANIYSSRGRWNDRERTIRRMKDAGVSKEVGISWIEVEKEVHEFVVGDRLHPKSWEIRDLLGEIYRMIDDGYGLDKQNFHYYLD
ncbi:pentatricopeptide repeat-containing protein At3g05340 [Impatiens glandulifera]|uniref:pentatricopeptide repeat-containing protein At3g05340 n=1 Tax=Impatiens glandulifera TaxID=253017 RepID=UPI001FB0793B|nr:pentatricopeptide repeat-containing protein At3g05340 [Impatiens glandulifera]